MICFIQETLCYDFNKNVHRKNAPTIRRVGFFLFRVYDTSVDTRKCNLSPLWNDSKWVPFIVEIMQGENCWKT